MRGLIKATSAAPEIFETPGKGNATLADVGTSTDLMAFIHSIATPNLLYPPEETSFFLSRHLGRLKLEICAPYGPQRRNKMREKWSLVSK
jgi:hypothetical protein